MMAPAGDGWWALTSPNSREVVGYIHMASSTKLRVRLCPDGWDVCDWTQKIHLVPTALTPAFDMTAERIAGPFETADGAKVALRMLV